MMKKAYHSIALLAMVAVAILATGCLKNDIPYPVIEAGFTQIEAEHQLGAAIDKKNHTVTITFDEQADLKNVRITKFKVFYNDENDSIRHYDAVKEPFRCSTDFSSPIDLSNPEGYKVILSLYQDYTWTIIARQPIERRFSVDRQIGAAEIDENARTVTAYISKNSSLAAVGVRDIKLGPAEVSTTTPDLTGQTVDFTNPVSVTVAYHDTQEQWTINVLNSDVDLAITSVDAWTRVIWVQAAAEEGKKNGLQYRAVGEEKWTTVNSDNITHDGATYSTCISGLEPLTQYEVRATSGDLVSTPVSATTEGELPLPDATFESWHKEGKIYCPWPEGGTSFWCTGNKGATTLGESNSLPTTTDTWNGLGTAADLTSKFVGVSVLGKMAAGNIFTGDYFQTVGTNGILHFGRPFTGRPTRLRGHFKYTSKTIDHTLTETRWLKGQPDTCFMYIALTDWDEQYEIRTDPKNRQLFDPNSPAVIAYGEYKSGQSVPNWTDLDIKLNYRATNRKPKYILIVCSASKYGDYFAGGDGSQLIIDDFSLDWDY